MSGAPAQLFAGPDAVALDGVKARLDVLRYRGVIAFDALDAAAGDALPIAQDDAWARLRLPGIELQWRAGLADVAMTDGILAIATGRARDASASSDRSGEAFRWLERYARSGARSADGIGGAFAVIIVDSRRRQALLLVDRFSIEPLCYAEAEGTLTFANRACAVAGVRASLDPQSIYDYLYFHVIPAPQTAFRGVQRLPPGHRLLASASGSELQPHWRPTFVESDRRDLAGRLRQFVELVEHSVRVEADDPATACFLSGGTDSSTVAGMLTRVRGEPAHAYSIGFEADGYDEMAYARIAARHFGLVHHEYYVTPDDLVAAIPLVAATMDQPFGNSSVVPAYFCALRARQDGFTRMLAGDGGDELFAGNSRYATQTLFELFHRLPPAVRTALEGPATRWKVLRSVPGLKKLGGYVRHARVSMPDRLHTFNLLHRLGEDVVLEPAFRAAIDSQQPVEQQRLTWNSLATTSLVNQMLAYDWKFTLADNDLPKVRMATELADIGVGFPFLSREMTDFSLSLPPQWKLNRMTLRWFFKRALRDFLPAEVLRKKKHGFGLPFGVWMLRHEPLNRLARESLEAVAERGIVNPRFTRELLSKRLPEAPGYYGEMVWVLMMFEQWMRARRTN